MNRIFAYVQIPIVISLRLLHGPSPGPRNLILSAPSSICGITLLPFLSSETWRLGELRLPPGLCAISVVSSSLQHQLKSITPPPLHSRGAHDVVVQEDREKVEREAEQEGAGEIEMGEDFNRSAAKASSRKASKKSKKKKRRQTEPAVSCSLRSISCVTR